MSDDSTPRRNEGRFSINSDTTRVTATFKDGAGATKEVRGQLADMSLRGVRIDLSYRIPTGDPIDLRIEVPGQSLVICRSAIVRWQQPRDTKSWWTGCELLEPLSEGIIEQLATAHVLNRRRDPRYQVDRPVRVRTELSNSTHSTRVVNYSKGGFCLLFSEPIQLPHERLMLLVPAGDKERTIPARVMWSGPAQGKFAVGCAFTSMDGFVHLRDYAEPKRTRRRLVIPARSAMVPYVIAISLIATIGLQVNWLVQARPDVTAVLRAGWSTWVVEPLKQKLKSAETQATPPSTDHAGNRST
jgi:hypothetical protein